MQKLILSTAYFPPVEYLGLLAAANQVFLEDAENFQKQSYRNRTVILAANGPLTLSIPLCHTKPKISVRDVRIDYVMPWQRNHWKSISAAYNNSPYFLYFQDFFIPFFQKKYDFLFDYNLELLQLLLRLLKIEKTLNFSGNFIPPNQNETDYKTLIHPKKMILNDYPLRIVQPYCQVFNEKFGFVPNLSILDLLFNEGNNSKNYLIKFCTFAAIRYDI